jgi:hypothetical protein
MLSSKSSPVLAAAFCDGVFRIPLPHKAINSYNNLVDVASDRVGVYILSVVQKIGY